VVNIARVDTLSFREDVVSTTGVEKYDEACMRREVIMNCGEYTINNVVINATGFNNAHQFLDIMNILILNTEV
jgi:hypothetical protein